VILGAKNRATWDTLYSALSQGTIKKSYVALIEGELKTEARVANFIGSPHRGAKKMKVYSMPPSPPVRALPAETTFRPLQYLDGFKLTLVEAIASPARRHQIRAHAAYIGHPLIGDALYGSKRSLGALCSQPRDLFLHAWRLAFKHPTTGEDIRIESDFHPELAARSGINPARAILDKSNP
jgi:23S rRNA pseudouridine1911/1915/1917 synthase